MRLFYDAVSAFFLVVFTNPGSYLVPDIVHSESADLPTVQLDGGTFVGKRTGNVTEFLGIPYSLPPVGDLRLRLPVPNLPYSGTYNATSFGAACPQQSLRFPAEVAATIAPLASYVDLVSTSFANLQSEDCLTINVVTPKNVAADAKLPVVVWIYGGGFEIGLTALFPGEVIVHGSLDLNMPVIYVSMNYRVSAFGFLPGKEVKAAGVGNLGMQDQRLALRWVQKYISAFGGDPNRVIIWGESAGSMSVGLHMVTNGGNSEGLFHGGFMQSGSPIPAGDIADATHQAVYDSVVEGTGCSGANDTLQCLRELPFSEFNATSSQIYSTFSYQSLNLAFGPRIDGSFLTDDPQRLVLRGETVDVPFVTGVSNDEGTVFSLGNANITTDVETENYIASNYYPDASKEELRTLFEAYPSDPSAGSPFDTGSANDLTSQFKRLAAIQGDIFFQAPRRLLLQQRSLEQDVWAYLWKREKSTPFLGSFHASDNTSSYGPGELRDAIINFANNLDPNGPTLVNWPRYTNDAPTLFTLVDDPVQSMTLENDTFRAEAMSIVTNISVKYPF